TTRTADEYAVLLAPLLTFHGLSFGDIDAAIIATVVPAALFDLRQFCRRYINCEPLVIGDPNLDLGIGVHTHRPEAVGAGRLANLFYRQTTAIDHLDPDLTIRGLVLIHARNASKCGKPLA